jgi:hypothetical protein
MEGTEIVIEYLAHDVDIVCNVPAVVTVADPPEPNT